MCFSATSCARASICPPTCTATALTPAARCAQATSAQTVRLAGWCHRIRDHGGLLFIDLRDHYGITQCVADPDSPAFKTAERLRSEWVVRIDGKVRKRPAGTENPDLPTGAVEVFISEIEVLSAGGRTADAGVRRAGISGGHPAQIPLSRPAPRPPARQHHEARRDHRFAAPAHEGAGLLRVPDADPDRVEPGRRARLPRAVATASRQVLCAAAGAAAVQAVDHDRRASTAISRSRPASATRMRAPTAAPASSISSTSR